MNDNAPVFTARQYNASVNEGAPPDAEVLRCAASDRDLGDNARLTYELIQPPAAAALPFAIDADDCVLRVRNDVRERDLLAHASYRFSIVARDAGVRSTCFFSFLLFSCPKFPSFLLLIGRGSLYETLD